MTPRQFVASCQRTALGGGHAGGGAEPDVLLEAALSTIYASIAREPLRIAPGLHLSGRHPERGEDSAEEPSSSSLPALTRPRWEIEQLRAVQRRSHAATVDWMVVYWNLRMFAYAGAHKARRAAWRHWPALVAAGVAAAAVAWGSWAA